MIMTDQIWRTV